MKVKVKNQMGNGKEIKLGFSWTMFFFGAFVPLIRGDLKWFAIIVIGAIILFSFAGPLASILPLIFAFIYNKLYARDLYEKGYRGMTKEEDELFLSYVSA